MMKSLIILLICIRTLPMALGQQPPNVLDNIQEMTSNAYLAKVQDHPKYTNQLYHDIIKREDYRKNVFPYRQTLMFSVGYSSMQHYTNVFLQNRSSEQTFTSDNYFAQPILSLTHEIYWGSIFSTSYTLGYGSNNIYADGASIASKNFLVFAHPKLNYFRSEHFEAYFQLNVGFVYNDLDLNAIEEPILAHNVPANFKVYTGFTPIGFNLLMSDRIAVNTEFSLWSFETFHLGIKYRFQKNTIREEMWEEKMYKLHSHVQ